MRCSFRLIVGPKSLNRAKGWTVGRWTTDDSRGRLVRDHPAERHCAPLVLPRLTAHQHRQSHDLRLHAVHPALHPHLRLGRPQLQRRLHRGVRRRGAVRRRHPVHRRHRAQAQGRAAPDRDAAVRLMAGVHAGELRDVHLRPLAAGPARRLADEGGLGHRSPAAAESRRDDHERGWQRHSRLRQDAGPGHLLPLGDVLGERRRAADLGRARVRPAVAQIAGRGLHGRKVLFRPEVQARQQQALVRGGRQGEAVAAHVPAGRGWRQAERGLQQHPEGRRDLEG